MIWDGHAPPARFAAFALTIGLGCGLVWPALYPLSPALEPDYLMPVSAAEARHYEGLVGEESLVDTTQLASRWTGVLALLVGIVAAAVARPAMLIGGRADGRSYSSETLWSGIAGAFVGWQMVLVSGLGACAWRMLLNLIQYKPNAALPTRNLWPAIQGFAVFVVSTRAYSPARVHEPATDDRWTFLAVVGCIVVESAVNRILERRRISGGNANAPILS
jgi:hypothetical protein